MDRYLVFGYESRHRFGGVNDLCSSEVSLKEAKAMYVYWDNLDILDIEDGKVYTRRRGGNWEEGTIQSTIQENI